MPYNPQIEQTIVLSKRHLKLLDQIGEKKHRKRRPQLEFMIEQAAAAQGIQL